MKNSASLINTWVQQVSVLGKMDHLQQAILRTPSEINSPREALALAYQMLTDKQKIAFILADTVGELVSQAQIRNTLFFLASSMDDFANSILAGGTPSLFRYQQYQQTGPDTGQLPVLC
jgi:hypothetical protein